MTKQEEFQQRIQGIAKQKTEWTKDFVETYGKNRISKKLEIDSELKEQTLRYVYRAYGKNESKS